MRIIAIAFCVGLMGITCIPGTASGAMAYTAIDLYPLSVPGGYHFLTVATVSGGQAAGWGGGDATGNQEHALFWSGSANSAVDLNPSQFSVSHANDLSNGQQVGWGNNGGASSTSHALLWSGTSTSAVDLNPAGFSSSQANGTYNFQQVGYGAPVGTFNQYHALLWSGTVASAVDLNPAGFRFSLAHANDATQQVGWGTASATNVQIHALLWTGVPFSAVDLNPPGYLTSYAFGVRAAQQVGWGARPGQGSEALVWSGTSGSAVDLNPDGFACQAYGTNGVQQVGYGVGNTGATQYGRALVWNGTAASAVDLNPSNALSSTALSIDLDGNIFGVAGNNAVEWVPNRVNGDANFDGTVNIADLLILAQHYGQTGNVGVVSGDFNMDGKVDYSDLLLLAQRFGSAAPSASDLAGMPPSFEADVARAFASVPEPSTLPLLIAFGVVALRRSRWGVCPAKPCLS